MNIGSDAAELTWSPPAKVYAFTIQQAGAFSNLKLKAIGSRKRRPTVQPAPANVVPRLHNDFDTFMAELEADPENAQDLVDAGAWIADTFYAGEPETIRTTRLRKGLSQKQLAAALETSQAQIAKIESGRVDLLRSTMLKLMQALDLDANRLFALLENQASSARR